MRVVMYQLVDRSDHEAKTWERIRKWNTQDDWDKGGGLHVDWYKWLRNNCRYGDAEWIDLECRSWVYIADIYLANRSAQC
jgi:hypothetical protein